MEGDAHRVGQHRGLRRDVRGDGVKLRRVGAEAIGMNIIYAQTSSKPSEGHGPKSDHILRSPSITETSLKGSISLFRSKNMTQSGYLDRLIQQT